MSWRVARGGDGAWREALAPVKQEMRDCGRASTATLQEAIQALHSNCATWLSQARQHEVATDLALLVQQLDQGGAAASTAAHDASARVAARSACCHLLVAVLQQPQPLHAPGQALTAICAGLRAWADPQPGGLAAFGSERQLQQDALAALGVLLPVALPQLASHERAAVLAMLLALARPASALQPSQHGGGDMLSRAGGGGPRAALEWTEAQRLAVQALGAVCPLPRAPGGAAAGALADAELASIQRCLVELFSNCTAAGLREGSFHGRCYATLLRALTAAVAGDVRRGWVPHVGAMVEAFRRTLTYGAQLGRQGQDPLQPPQQRAVPPHAQPGQLQACVAQPAAQQKELPQQQQPLKQQQIAAQQEEVNGAGGGNSRYVPPHLRGSSRAAGSADKQGSGGGKAARAASGARLSGSTSEESDISDSEWGGSSSGRAAAPERGAAVKVRLALLLCIQSVVQADPQALHAHWATLLPVQQPLLQQPLSPHLVTVLLYDPVPKVRAMAASTIAALLEGPQQRQYLAVAEAKSMERPSIRGFTTLSTSLGFMAISLHGGLLQCVRHEDSLPVLAAALRALGVVCAALPYERLPPLLLPEVLTAVQGRMRGLLGTGSAAAGGLGDDEGPAVAAALACLAQALSTKAPCPGVKQYLEQTEAGTAASGAAAAATQLASQLPPGAAAATAPGNAACKSTRSAAMPVRALRLGEAPAGCVPGPAAPGPTGGLVEELLAIAASPSATLRAGALAALRGACVLYPYAMRPRHWPHITAAARLSMAGTLAVARSPRGSPHAPVVDSGSGVLAAGGSAGRTAPAAHPMGGSSGEAGGNSAEDKAGQQAVRLLAEFQTAMYSQQQQQQQQQQHQPACGPTLEELVSSWQEVLQLLLPDAVHHASPTMRTAAMSALGEVPARAFQGLAPSSQAAVLRVLAEAAQVDPAAPVRAAACKALAALADLAGPCGDAAHVAQLVPPLAAGAADSGVAVRIAAAQGLARVCNAIRIQQLAEQQAGGSDGAACSSSGSRAAEQQDNAAGVPSISAAAAETQGGAGPQPGAGSAARVAAQPSALPLKPVALATLCEAVLTAAQDTEKVRANGVRALGNLLAVWQPCWLDGSASSDAASSGNSGGGTSSSEWLSAALSCLQSSLTTGSLKVQWNACYAAAGLLRNAELLAAPSVRGRVEALLLLLTMLVRDSGNFKIRTHAAAALAAPPQRGVYGGVYADALLVVCAALEGLQEGGGTSGGAAAVSGDAAGSSGAAAAGAPAVAAAGAAGAGSGGGADAGSFLNYRYASGLAAQLAATLAHMLGLAGAAEGVRLRDALSRRLGTLVRVLQRVGAAAGGGAADGAGWEGSSSGGGGLASSADLLPADPFHGGCASPSSSIAPGGRSDCGGAAAARTGPWPDSMDPDQALEALQGMAAETAAAGSMPAYHEAVAGLLRLLQQR